VILTDKDYTVFKKEIKNYFDKKKIDIEISDDYELKTPEGSLFSGETNLYNLAKACRESEKKTWKELIEEFFDNILEGTNFQKTFDERRTDFDYAKVFIGVRFFNRAYFGDKEDSFVFVPLLEDVCLTLIFDLPNYTNSVLPGLIETWNKNEQELFHIGYYNIHIKYQYSIDIESIGDIQAYRVHTDHFYGNIVLLQLENKGLVGKHDSLIIVPNRHETFIYPIENEEVSKAIKYFVLIAQDRFMGPGSISKNLYWYKDKKFTLLLVTKNGCEVFINTTPEYLEMINSLKCKGINLL